MGRRRRRLPEGEFKARVGRMQRDGRGVAEIDGRTVGIHGALPGETVRFRYTRRRHGKDEGAVVEVLEASPDRVQPRCAHYHVCGGCSLQHLDSQVQIALKQEYLLDDFRQIGAVQPADVLPPIVNDSPWGYRRKARLGVKYVIKKEKLLVGFRERGSSLVADLTHCHVLHPRVGELLPQLRAMIDRLSIRDRVPQIDARTQDTLRFQCARRVSGADEFWCKGQIKEYDTRSLIG